MTLASIVSLVGRFYGYLIIAYVLMSWFPLSGVFADVHGVLRSMCEPYLALFRRFIPPIGAVDISPIVAILVLQFAVGALTVALSSSGL